VDARGTDKRSDTGFRTKMPGHDAALRGFSRSGHRSTR
jgi:hypothetical protein